MIFNGKKTKTSQIFHFSNINENNPQTPEKFPKSQDNSIFNKYIKLEGKCEKTFKHIFDQKKHQD